MPNMMAALSNIGGTSVQRRKGWLTPITRVPGSNATKTQNQLKLAGVPETCQHIWDTIGPKFTILSARKGDIAV